jgi:hypothetical protein
MSQIKNTLAELSEFHNYGIRSAKITAVKPMNYPTGYHTARSGIEPFRGNHDMWNDEARFKRLQEDINNSHNHTAEYWKSQYMLETHMHVDGTDQIQMTATQVSQSNKTKLADAMRQIDELNQMVKRLQEMGGRHNSSTNIASKEIESFINQIEINNGLKHDDRNGRADPTTDLATTIIPIIRRQAPPFPAAQLASVQPIAPESCPIKKKPSFNNCLPSIENIKGSTTHFKQGDDIARNMMFLNSSHEWSQANRSGVTGENMQPEEERSISANEVIHRLKILKSRHTSGRSMDMKFDFKAGSRLLSPRQLVASVPIE